MKLASLISVILFVLIALAHLARLVLGTEVTLDGKAVPMWVSVVATVVAVVLAWALWRERQGGDAAPRDGDQRGVQ